MVDPKRGSLDELPTHAIDGDGVHPSLANTEATAAGPSLPPHVPPQIGPYRVLRLLGEGGMGTVVECEQEQPLRRRVALKLIRTGLASGEFVARFDSERQTLAQMNHPAIARVFDAGASQWGPFFVMEFVAGEPVTTYCDHRTLTVRERLEVFIRVCEGVQHAHQNGVIHRDLKPSNILVTDESGRPAPKIIDFGIAKAIRPRPEEAPFRTLRGELMGTPEYMSPEQADPSRGDVDTRADVYSLGVILYELLVGALPFPARSAGAGALEAVSHRLREAEPPRPSTRLASLADHGQRTAQLRRASQHGLARVLRGDVDWIVLKAMERERERRYASVSELTADIGRYLELQPVLAGPPSAVYRIGKFVRRHRLGVAAGAVALLGLMAAAAGTSIGLVRAREAERRAVAEARTAEQVSEFLEGLFKVSDPSEARGGALTARDLLDRGAGRVRGDLAQQPLVQARMLASIGRVVDNLGDYPRARELLEEALAIRRAQLGPNHPEVATSLHDLALVLDHQGQPGQAETLARQALAIDEYALGSEHPALGNVLSELGALARRRGDLASARSLHERALAIREKVLGPDDPVLAGSLNNLALVLKDRGDYAAARPLLERSLAIREQALGHDHPDVANALNNLAILLCQSGDCAAAQPLFERALSIRERSFGPEHPWVAESVDNLASVLYSSGEFAAALPLYERALAIRERSLGPDHPRLAVGLGNLGALLSELGQCDRARVLLERALAITEKVYGPDHGNAVTTLDELASLESDTGNPRTARVLADQALAIADRTLGPEHPDTATALRTAASVRSAAGDVAGARPLAERAVSVAERVLGPDHPDTATAHLTLARVDFALGDRERARALAGPALESLARALGESHPQVAFERARWNALEGNRAETLRWLRLAAARGFANAARVLTSEIGYLRGDAELRSILAGMGGRADRGGS